MKNIEIEEDLYQYIASQTQFIGESASSILRRLLLGNSVEQPSSVQHNTQNIEEELNIVSDSAEINEKVEVSDITTKENVPLTESDDVENLSHNEQANGSVFDYLNKEELAMQRGAVGRFLLILGALYRVHSNKFSVVSDIRGRDRLYFSDNLNELTESGSSTKPFQIPNSPYWVVTNSNTTRKKMILTKVATALGYSDSDAEDIRELL